MVRLPGRFHRGQSQEPISLSRFAGLESLYAIGPLERGRGEVSIFDNVSLISEVRDSQTNVSLDFNRRAAFLVYAIVENWRRVTLRKPIDSEQQLAEQLCPSPWRAASTSTSPFLS